MKIWKCTFWMCFLFLAVLLTFSLCSEEADADIHTWTGGGADVLASNPLNWDNGVVETGDDILIDAGSKTCQWDISTIVNDILIESSYTGTFEAVTWVKLTGNFTSPVGKINYAYSSIWMMGDEKTFSYPSIIQGLRIGANVTAGSFTVYNLIIDSGKTLTLGGNVDVFTWDRWDGSFCNHGTVTGDYLFTFNVVTAFNYNIDLNNFTSSLDIKLLLRSGASGNSVLTSISNIHSYNFTLASESLDKTITLNLNGHSLTASSITIGTRGILSNSAGSDSVVSCASLDSSNAASSFVGTNIDLVLTGGGSLKLKATEAPEDLSFIGATTIYQNTVISGALAIADGVTVTDGAGTYRLNVTSAVENHTILGSWDFGIYFDGTPDRLNITVEELMGGVVYFQNETTLLWTGGSMNLVPDGWCDVVLLAWDEATGNLYGAFYFNGNASFNGTVDSGRYSLWNGSASIAGIQGANGSIYATLNATSTLTFTINPCPRFVTDPDTLDYYGGRYYYNADTNEENAGLAQTYTLACNFPSQIVIAASGEVQGDISDSLQHNYSLLVTDALGGWTYLNWTVEISLLQWNLRATIVSEENGWLKVQYDFDFQSNKSLLAGVQWNFGDGNGSKDLAPVHAYDRAGVYLVTLIMFDEFGRSGTSTVEITVGDPEADQAEAYLNYWLNERLAGAVAIILISVLLAALYVYVADKEWGGAHRVFPVAVILMGFIIALIVYGGY